MVAPLGPPSEWLPPSERLVFQGESVVIGQVRCRPTAAHFRNCGEARTFCIVFPRSAIIIRRPNQPPLVEDPSVVTFYNRAQEYERFELSPEGDRCDWFAYSPDVVCDAVRRFDPDAAADEDRPLRLSSASSSPDVFRRQRLLFERVRRDLTLDPLYVEETAIGLLDRVVGDAYASRPERDMSPRRAYELTDAARRLIALRYASPLSLRHVARCLDTSVFHLCRVFRSVHGTSIHRYRTQLRIRHALECLANPAADLGQLAFELGFSTHSHFTAAFKREFGATPSRIRAAVADRRPLASFQ
jgi:AraC family transcriptional regulator